MNRICLLFAALFISLAASAQDPLYVAVKSLVQEKYPAMTLENRILAINVWSEKDVASRETNKSFEKTASIYRVAKLKGGSGGMVGITINLTDPTPVAVATLKQDGIAFLLPLDGEKVAELLSDGTMNVVFDASGNEIHRDLESADVFESILKLISR